MKKKEKKEEKKIPLPGKIIFDDGFGTVHEIKASSLISLFFSNELRENFKKNPKKRYSIKELLDLAHTPCSVSSIRSNITINTQLFNTEDISDITKNGKRKVLVKIKVAKLKPIAEKIFDWITNYEKEYKE